MKKTTENSVQGRYAAPAFGRELRAWVGESRKAAQGGAEQKMLNGARFRCSPINMRVKSCGGAQGRAKKIFAAPLEISRTGRDIQRSKLVSVTLSRHKAAPETRPEANQAETPTEVTR